MSRGLEAEWTAALKSEFGITPAVLVWFDFQSGPVGVWTGTHPLTATGTGDLLLDNKQFEPIVNGSMVHIGDNSFNYQGSEALTLSLAIPETPTNHMTIASVDPDEYQARTAIMWRAIMVTPPYPGAAAVWAFRRVRAGAMDELSITYNGEEHMFTLTVEAHASMISSATGSTYLDQKRFDPADNSQDFAVSIANNPNSPSRGSSGGYGGGMGSLGGGAGRGHSGRLWAQY